ncbi:hypothetical protein DIPPA_07263 [Diplonema papillatum]|nr:hypothetical protein DIPPA_07263 [Diplonema papillatum]
MPLSTKKRRSRDSELEALSSAIARFDDDESYSTRELDRVADRIAVFDVPAATRTQGGTERPTSHRHRHHHRHDGSRRSPTDSSSSESSGSSDVGRRVASRSSSGPPPALRGESARHAGRPAMGLAPEVGAGSRSGQPQGGIPDTRGSERAREAAADATRQNRRHANGEGSSHRHRHHGRPHGGIYYYDSHGSCHATGREISPARKKAARCSRRRRSGGEQPARESRESDDPAPHQEARAIPRRQQHERRGCEDLAAAADRKRDRHSGRHPRRPHGAGAPGNIFPEHETKTFSREGAGRRRQPAAVDASGSSGGCEKSAAAADRRRDRQSGRHPRRPHGAGTHFLGTILPEHETKIFSPEGAGAGRRRELAVAASGSSGCEDLAAAADRKRDRHSGCHPRRLHGTLSPEGVAAGRRHQPAALDASSSSGGCEKSAAADRKRDRHSGRHPRRPHGAGAPGKIFPERETRAFSREGAGRRRQPAALDASGSSGDELDGSSGETAKPGRRKDGQIAGHPGSRARRQENGAADDAEGARPTPGKKRAEARARGGAPAEPTHALPAEHRSNPARAAEAAADPAAPPQAPQTPPRAAAAAVQSRDSPVTELRRAFDRASAWGGSSAEQTMLKAHSGAVDPGWGWVPSPQGAGRNEGGDPRLAPMPRAAPMGSPLGGSPLALAEPVFEGDGRGGLPRHANTEKSPPPGPAGGVARRAGLHSPAAAQAGLRTGSKPRPRGTPGSTPPGGPAAFPSHTPPPPENGGLSTCGARQWDRIDSKNGPSAPVSTPPGAGSTTMLERLRTLAAENDGLSTRVGQLTLEAERQSGRLHSEDRSAAPVSANAQRLRTLTAENDGLSTRVTRLTLESERQCDRLPSENRPEAPVSANARESVLLERLRAVTAENDVLSTRVGQLTSEANRSSARPDASNGAGTRGAWEDEEGVVRRLEAVCARKTEALVVAEAAAARAGVRLREARARAEAEKSEHARQVAELRAEAAGRERELKADGDARAAADHAKIRGLTAKVASLQKLASQAAQVAEAKAAEAAEAGRGQRGSASARASAEAAAAAANAAILEATVRLRGVASTLAAQRSGSGRLTHVAAAAAPAAPPASTGDASPRAALLLELPRLEAASSWLVAAAAEQAADLAAARQAAAALESERSMGRAKLAKYKAKLKETERASNDLRRSADDAAKQLSRKHTECLHLNAQVAAHRLEAARLQTEAEAVSSEADGHLKRAADCTEKLGAAAEEIESLRAALSKAAAAAEGHKAHASRADKAKAELRETVRKLEEALERAREDGARVSGQLHGEATARVEAAAKVEREVARLRAASAAATAAKEAAEAELDESRREMETLSSDFTSAKAAMQQRAEELERTLEGRESQLRSTDDALNDTRGMLARERQLRATIVASNEQLQETVTHAAFRREADGGGGRQPRSGRSFPDNREEDGGSPSNLTSADDATRSSASNNTTGSPAGPGPRQAAGKDGRVSSRAAPARRGAGGAGEKRGGGSPERTLLLFSEDTADAAAAASSGDELIDSFLRGGLASNRVRAPGAGGPADNNRPVSPACSDVPGPSGRRRLPPDLEEDSIDRIRDFTDASTESKMLDLLESHDALAAIEDAFAAPPQPRKLGGRYKRKGHRSRSGGGSLQQNGPLAPGHPPAEARVSWHGSADRSSTQFLGQMSAAQLHLAKLRSLCGSTAEEEGGLTDAMSKESAHNDDVLRLLHSAC